MPINYTKYLIYFQCYFNTELFIVPMHAKYAIIILYIHLYI